jgi:hypothetical protein
MVHALTPFSSSLDSLFVRNGSVSGRTRHSAMGNGMPVAQESQGGLDSAIP